MKFTESTYRPIFTKWLSPTNTKGSRVCAYDAEQGGESLVLSWDFELGVFDNHAKAAQALAEKLGWQDDYLAGSHESGFIFVRMPKEERK